MAVASPPTRRNLEHLTAGDRRRARALRRAARIVAAAGLPAEYRRVAFARVAELELERDDVQAGA